jgi:hypothetical protein
MIFEHYRELVTPADAQKWWDITPKSGATGGRARHKGLREKGARKSAKKYRVGAGAKPDKDGTKPD